MEDNIMLGRLTNNSKNKSMSSAWENFLINLERAKKRLGCSYTGSWYRGQSKSSWELMPTLFRYNHGTKRERNLYDQFISRAGYLIDSSKSSWEILAEMRHHSIPTRLLDWTESFAVALYFAIKEPIQNPCIWILNPYKLTKQSKDKEWIFNFEIDKDFDYAIQFLLNRNWPYDLPVAVDSPWKNSRIQAQQGFFTVHGNLEKPLEIIAKKYVKQVFLPNDAIDDARSFLKLVNINEYTLFPDLDGLARWLIEQYNF